jgi:ATP-dependent DNA ligase
MNYQCQKYEELAGPDEVYEKLKDNVRTAEDPIPNWLIQLKYDGIWALVKIGGDHYEVFSKTGQLKKTGRLSQGQLHREPYYLVGEFMYGSQWSTHPERAGKLFIFDCLSTEGRDLSSLPYKDRYRAAVSAVLQLGQPFNILPCYSISKLGEFWQSLREQTEGFIIRRWSSPWSDTLFKLKFEVEDDFVVLGHIEGQNKHAGRMGALKVGQYDNGTLVHVMNVGGGFTDQQRVEWWSGDYAIIGTVVQVKGKGRFNTGALRHPNFVRIRDDKLPHQCILKREQSK